MPSDRSLCQFALAYLVLVGCAGPAAPAPRPSCAAPPDPNQALADAWTDYQPGQPLSLPVNARRHFYALQALLLAAGMYGDAPAELNTVYPRYAQQFVRDLGAGRNQATAAALGRLATSIEQTRDQADLDLSDRCALLAARRMLRADPVQVSTDWVLQTVTAGFAPHFQASIAQIIRHCAEACHIQPEVAATTDLELGCVMRRVGL